MFDFVELKTIFVIFHLVGVVLGMGAALMTDIMFIKGAKNKILNAEEISFISLGSRTVWVGLFLIIFSGVTLFSLNPDGYLNSSKFLTKMLVAAVLTINGAIFHFKHLPFLRAQVDKDLTISGEFRKKSIGLFISGAVSSTSWFAALILGMLRKVPYEFKIIASVYFLILLGAILAAFLARRMFLKNNI